MDGSPAHLSHIVANRDYLIGCLQFEYQDVDEFSSKLSVYHGMEADPTLDLYVFNSSTYAGKFVKVKPSNLWKGEGLLGIEFGVGLFDNMQLLTILETLAKRELRSAEIPQPEGMLDGNKSLRATEFDVKTDQVYVDHQDDKKNAYKIRSTDLLPALTFKLKDYVYKV
jgi:hypothetical protein